MKILLYSDVHFSSGQEHRIDDLNVLLPRIDAKLAAIKNRMPTEMLNPEEHMDMTFVGDMS